MAAFPTSLTGATSPAASHTRSQSASPLPASVAQNQSRSHTPSHSTSQQYPVGDIADNTFASPGFDPALPNGLSTDMFINSQLQQPQGSGDYLFNQDFDLSNQFPTFDSSAGPSADNSLLSDSSFFDPSNNIPPQATLDPNALSIDTSGQMNMRHTVTPPQMLQPNMRASQSPSPHQSLYAASPRTRNLSESLDPSSAAFPQLYAGGGGGDWGAGPTFRNHRRAPSDCSDISSHSAQASPYLGNIDNYDHSQHVSPLLPSLPESALFGDSLTQFSLNDANNALLSHVSPGASPSMSPHVGTPQQPLPQFTSTNNFGLTTDLSQLTGAGDGIDPFSAVSQGPNPAYTQFGHSPVEGQADTMSPPEINIDFVPTQTNPFERAQKLELLDTLLPPEVRRKRAKSDPYATSLRSPVSSVIVSGRGRSPSLQPGSLSPLDVPGSASRSTSASRKAGRGRSASASFESHRDHMLDLANPERSASSSGEAKRQKHPATYQCTLCPKRFTRAYNLRSHLRTHTDERPFVCTVCGKAFARQHDRKRHEGLHTGEKKFVCRGGLKNNSEWGCGRKFARADALGRHFRSEAGRVCIRPLIEEEAADRQRQWLEQQQQQRTQGMQPGINVGAPTFEHALPAGILQLYPEFAKLDWSALTGGGATSAVTAKDESDQFDGLSSFDASSGGEWDGISDNEMNYDMPMSSQQQPMNLMDQQMQFEQQQQAFGNQRGM